MTPPFKKTTLWPLYIRRLLGSQIIQPITNSHWYQPRALIVGNNAAPETLTTPTSALSASVLSEADAYLAAHNTRAFLVSHHGELIHSRYWRFKSHYTFNSMSMVKTVQALAIGIAIEQGLIRSVQEPAATYLPEWKNDARASITIEHLLTMQSGLKSDLHLHGMTFFPAIVPLYLGTNIHQHALGLPAVATPGTYFEYNNYNTQLLGIILERASGVSSAAFFSRYLWQPLECHDAALWLDREGGTARTFSTLFARAEDWLRVASLFLNQGVYKNTRIVSAEWIEQMCTPRNTPARGVAGGKSDYGYQLWLGAHDYGLIRGIPWFEATHAKAPHAQSDVIYFEGMRGQYLFVCPQQQLIVLRMGERPKKDWDGSRVINQLLRALNQP